MQPEFEHVEPELNKESTQHGKTNNKRETPTTKQVKKDVKATTPTISPAKKKNG